MRAESSIRANIIFCMNQRNRCDSPNRRQLLPSTASMMFNADQSPTSYDSWLETMTNSRRNRQQHSKRSRNGNASLAIAFPSRRHRTNRWTRAAVARFATRLVRRRVLRFAPPRQLHRSASPLSIMIARSATVMILLVGLLSSGAIAQIKPDSQPVITIKRETSLGCSPDYSAEIYRDGTVVYHGVACVKVVGDKRHKISADAVDQLIKAFDQANYFSFKD